MERLTILFLALIVASVAPASATTPLPPPPDPARLEAARGFVRVPAIWESLLVDFQGLPSARTPLKAALYAEADRLRPEMDRQTLGHRVRLLINFRIDRALRESQSEILEDFATEFARLFNVEQLTAATDFYGSPLGLTFALRMVTSDPIFANVLLARFQGPISADMESLVADAEAGERLRAQVNSR